MPVEQDIRKHIQDIATKYIIPDTKSDGAVRFIPAEAIFAEIQGRHPDLVEESNFARVWMVSPTTLWAVLKDAATRKQVHNIQKHPGPRAKDFERFRQRMDGMARHIEQAHSDVQQVNTSVGKISSRFEKIERVELEQGDEEEYLPSGNSKNSDS